MTKATAKSNPEARARMSRRRGVTTAGMVVGMTMLLGFVALSVDLSVLMLYEVETRSASDAAALAGVGQLWDRTLLPEHHQYLDLPSDGLKGASYVQLQVRRAQAESRRFVALNKVCGTPLQLRDEDIIITALGNENSLTIRCPHTTERGNPVTRIVGRSLGLNSADLVVESQAVLDQRVYGFAPGAGAKIPVVPIVIDTDSWYGQVEHSPLVVLEICCQGDVVGNADLCRMEPLGGSAIADAQQGYDRYDAAADLYAELDQLRRQIEFGIDRQDLAALPGQAIALDESTFNGKLDVPLARVADAAMLADVGNALLAIAGQPRVWLLGNDLVGAKGAATGRQVESFASARVVHCEVQDQTLRVILAPSLLATSSALVRADQPRNPWLAKAYLVR